SAALAYTGSALTVVFVKQSNTGIATVTIDGTVVDQLDTYSATHLFQQQKTYTSAPGNHTVSVVVSGNKNAASGGPFLIFDAFMVGIPTQQFLTLYSQPGDGIGQGGERVLTSGGATFNGSVEETGTAIFLQVSGYNGSWWILRFAAPRGQPLVPGTYENAVRSPFRPNGVPGLEVAGEGRGCNDLSGRFVADVVEFVAGEIQNFHATFEQHCGSALPALFGEVRYSRTATTVTFEDTDPRVTFNGNWTSFADPNNSGGNAQYAGDPGASLALDFTGNFVNVVFLKQPNTGIAAIAIDGAVVDQ